jgi:AP-4 complex subunit epsilon-1
MSLLERVQPTDLIIKMVSWIFGEIGSNVYANNPEELQEIAEVLIKSLSIEYEDRSTKVWVLNALAKLSSSKAFTLHK